MPEKKIIISLKQKKNENEMNNFQPTKQNSSNFRLPKKKKNVSKSQNRENERNLERERERKTLIINFHGNR